VGEHIGEEDEAADEAEAARGGAEMPGHFGRLAWDVAG
jgi:hypothetical protein